MTPPLISCIVPVYNGERYLSDALDSILNQSYRPLEIIVVDDGSTDGTARLIAGYGERVRYLYQPNAGPAAARNFGLTAARGEFVAFLDADDLWHPRKLERQMERFLERPGLDLCVTMVQNFWMPELAEEMGRLHGSRYAHPLPGYVTATLLTRRSLFDSIGFFDPGLRHGDSTEWFLRARAQNLMIELLPEVLVYRRVHPASLSRNRASESRDEFLKLLKARLNGRHAGNHTVRSV
jgi:glycosyltransferase involved in cell wall biosynthesis